MICSASHQKQPLNHSTLQAVWACLEDFPGMFRYFDLLKSTQSEHSANWFSFPYVKRCGRQGTTSHFVKFSWSFPRRNCPLQGDVYKIPNRVSFLYNFIPVPYWVSICVYMIPTKISFQNEFIPVAAPDRSFRSGTKSSQTLNKYHVKEVRAHSSTELGLWIGWADQLTHIFDPPMLLSHLHSRMRTSM